MSKKLVALLASGPFLALADLPTEKLYAIAGIVCVYLIAQGIVSAAQVKAGVHRTCLTHDDETEATDAQST